MIPKIVIYTISIILILALQKVVYCQDFRTPFVIHPVIGDTLDNIEAIEFELFTTYNGFLKGPEGFQWAIFYIETDGSVYILAQYAKDGSLYFNSVKYVSFAGSNLVKKIRGKIDRKVLKGDYPWSYAFYFTGGFGKPQLYRIEFGYNSSNLSIGATLGANQRCSEYDEYGLIGIALTISAPISQKFSPYVFINYGLSINSVFGMWDYEADEILLIYIGSKIPIYKSVLFRPEIGVAYTTSCLENCGGLFNQGIPEFKKETHLGFHFAFEIYL